jgi:hypothetical protein
MATSFGFRLKIAFRNFQRKGVLRPEFRDGKRLTPFVAENKPDRNG